MTKTSAELEKEWASLKAVKSTEHLLSDIDAKDKEIADLKAKVKSMEHLASAVDAKDREIADLNRSHREEFNTLVKEHTKELEVLRKEKQKVENDSKNVLEKSVENVEKKYKKVLEELTNKLSMREKQLSKIIGFHGSLLKSLQGQLETSLEVNEYFINEVSK